MRKETRGNVDQVLDIFIEMRPLFGQRTDVIILPPRNTSLNGHGRYVDAALGQLMDQSRKANQEVAKMSKRIQNLANQL